MPMWAGSLSFL